MGVKERLSNLELETFEQVSSVIQPEVECFVWIGRSLNWFILTWIPWFTNFRMLWEFF